VSRKGVKGEMNWRKTALC